MIQHDVEQGSAEWLRLRAQHFCASDAAAAMGLSKYKTRQAYMLEKKTGYTPEVDGYTQSLYDSGHASEAAMRPVAERILGEDLFPTTGSEVVDGLPLLASFDGITMTDEVVWEHKLSNASLSMYISTHDDLPDTHWPQVEQQLLISGASRVLFTCGDEPIWYVSKPNRRARLLACWKQFAADLEAFVVPAPASPAPTAITIEALPALVVQAEGKVTSSNLPAFKAAAAAYIANINTELSTDQHFADAKSTVKFLKEGEDRLETVKAQVLAQATSIDEVCRTIDAISDEMRQKRLTLDKLVTRREAEIKAAIIVQHQTLLDEHRAELNKRLGNEWVPRTMGPFAEAIKGKRNLSSCEDAAGTALANAKIQMNELADRIAENLTMLKGAGDCDFLFPDLAQLVLKAPEDFLLMVMARINSHAAAVAEKVAVQVVAPPVTHVQAAQPQERKEDTRPPLSTGEINTLLGGGLVMSVPYITGLGFKPAPNPPGKHSGTYWHAGDVVGILGGVGEHVARVAAVFSQPMRP